jgi:hypothetical protein
MIFKRLTVALAALFALAGPAFASGTIPFSLSQQFDQFGKPLAGCLFYTIQAGTTSTPQNAFQDSALTIPLPNPQTCDAAGRLPQMFLADGTIKVRLTDKNGTAILVVDNIQVVGASSGSGGGGTVDPTTILATGDIKVTYGTGTISGFVRANGRTIGSASSGATERANADCQALFEDLWDADANLTVSGGRGATAAADWAANKQLTLPDMRGRTIAGLDDMGNTAAGRLTSTYFGATPTLLGAGGGAQNHTLSAFEIPQILSTNEGNTTISGNTSGIPSGDQGHSTTGGGNINVDTYENPINQGYAVTSTLGTHTLDIRSDNTGGQPHSIVQPTMLATIYIKL